MSKKLNLPDRSREKRDKMLEPVVKRLPHWVTPNFLAYMRFPLGLIMFLLVYNRAGHFLLICFIGWLLAKFIDSLDGTLARYRKIETWYGSILDAFSDRFVLLMLVYAAYTAYPLAWSLKWAAWFIGFMFVTDFIRFIARKTFKENYTVNTFWQYLEMVFRAVFAAAFLGQYIYFY
ncbi:CDP-alcohol phosphatidyltransferase family protein [Patescibacteria group bacterium]|nr:CDP-alcohol phosphatidyltransferase family protein [Patescibacteria group bacterium]MBU1673755.1 CDP-alcohol phosphatidyltransferase family protein [Patescibacteria group bacterium]MBU1964095.1 CDP-alcohol phosphatidyltransferase family protein [Patescibacteria group bacterium]